MMSEIYSVMKSKSANLQISNNPIIKKRMDVLCDSNSGLTFEITNRISNEARCINMKRFVECDQISKIRQDYRALVRVRDNVLSLALEEFEKIKKYHFILEEIYGSAMDFSAKEQFTREFCNKIF